MTDYKDYHWVGIVLLIFSIAFLSQDFMSASKETQVVYSSTTGLGHPMNSTQATEYLENASVRRPELSFYFHFCFVNDDIPTYEEAKLIQETIIYGSKRMSFVCHNGYIITNTMYDIPQVCIDRSQIICNSHNETALSLKYDNVRIVDCVNKNHEVISRKIDC